MCLSGFSAQKLRTLFDVAAQKDQHLRQHADQEDLPGIGVEEEQVGRDEEAQHKQRDHELQMALFAEHADQHQIGEDRDRQRHRKDLPADDAHQPERHKGRERQRPYVKSQCVLNGVPS